jgi:hypothetical protein
MTEDEKEVDIGLIKNLLIRKPVSEKYMQALKESMQKIGMIYPLLCTIVQNNILDPIPTSSEELKESDTYHVYIVDGNKRAEIAKELGWKTVKCNVIYLSESEVYETVKSLDDLDDLKARLKSG